MQMNKEERPAGFLWAEMFLSKEIWLPWLTCAIFTPFGRPKTCSNCPFQHDVRSKVKNLYDCQGMTILERLWLGRVAITT
jgi:hypothetical protein